MTVLEKLRELPCDNAECKGICQLCGVCPCDKFALRSLAALLALAEAAMSVRAAEYQSEDYRRAAHHRIIKALAELEKEAKH